jgi:5-methylthioadenosine/S-adenosylhomocysteine deaminase
MGLEDKIGSLETGKLADVIAVDLGALASQPIYDPVSALVYGSNSNQVTHSWIHGQAAMENRQLTRMHVGDIQLEARDWGKRMAEQAAR